MPSIVKRIQKQDQVCVLFLPMNAAMWNYGKVLLKLELNKRFRTIVVTAPSIHWTNHQIVSAQDAIVDRLDSVRSEVVKGFNGNNNLWVSIKKFKPDIIFYTQPYDGLVPIQYEYWKNLSSLFCYYPYGFVLSDAKWSWDNALQNYAWRHYVSFSEDRNICQLRSRIKGVNVVPVGYFFEDEYQYALTDRALMDKVWRNDKRKRLIWAPHHSITAGASFKTSAFIEICDEMVRLREKYRDRVVFAFKPHPMLKDNLYQRWGKEKTEEYYANWEKSDNSFLDEGDFVSLFAGSDAMIHCSGSFIVDYIYTGKPVQYVYCKDRNTPDFGKIGEASLKAHYPARGVSDIEKFIDEVVLAGNDPMRMNREDVYNRYLKSPNGKTFSENILADIISGLSGNS